MITHVIVVLVAAAIAHGCQVTDHKHVGESCKCSDVCLGNSYCQRDGHGGYTCQCLVCQHFDAVYGQCVKIPGYHEPCNEQCSSNFVCTGSNQNNRTCQCPSSHYYDEQTDSCIRIPGVGESCTEICLSNLECKNGTCQCDRNQQWNQEEGKCTQSQVCVADNTKGCQHLPNGNYPACFPECQKGVFISCSNGYTYVRDCALGWYVRPNGERFVTKLVYDPRGDRCEKKVAYCPRALDNLIEE